MFRAFKAIRRADVCVLLLDATQGVLVQDRELADRIVAEGRACVIALNKWDVVPSKDEKTYIGCIDNIHASLNHLRWAEVVLVSAKTGQRIDKVLTAAKKAETQFRRWVTTRALTEIINDALNFHSPPRVGSKSGRIHYCVQSSTAPPTFVLFCNDPKLFADSYRQYLERKIRESLGFEGTPIKIIFRQKTLRKVIMSKDANGEMKRKYV
jgi:GTP-binding protein